jgi:Putative zinc-finger
MDHSEATNVMAAERYLLDELTPELRESFEEHAFDCPECSLDLRCGTAFIDAAKRELPRLVETRPSKTPSRSAGRRSFWSSIFQPAFAIPAFAALLAVVGFQNLVTIPSLRSAAGEPSIVPSSSFHAGTRGAAHAQVLADQKRGAVVAIELPEDQAFRSFGFDLYDPAGKQTWSRSLNVANGGGAADGTVSLVIPKAALQQKSYTLVISGIAAQGERTEIDRRILDIQFAE